MLQQSRALSWVEKATSRRYKLRRFRMMQEMFSATLDAIERILRKETPMTDEAIAEELGLGVDAHHYYPVWKENPLLRSIIERYSHKMHPNYAKQVRERVKQSEQERERRRLKEAEVRYVARHYGQHYAAQVHAGQSRL